MARLLATGLNLCGTCRHTSACCLRGWANAPVFSCEEYERGDGPSGGAGGGTAPARGQPEAPRADGKPLGLCSDCAKRKTCTFPRPEGGVWHCEEYATE